MSSESNSPGPKNESRRLEPHASSPRANESSAPGLDLSLRANESSALGSDASWRTNESSVFRSHASLHAIDSEVLIVGGGPAGIAAAASAHQAGVKVTIVDDNPGLGGQIWRGAELHPPSAESRRWLNRVHVSDIRFIRGTRIISQPNLGTLLAESQDMGYEIRFQKLIIATGARERFLPFPGWTLPGVVGAGGLQALVKSGAPIRGARVVLAGSGPLLLAVGAYLRGRGAQVRVIAEQVPSKRLFSFWVWLALHYPWKAARGVMLRPQAGWRYLTGCWVVRAIGDEKLFGVTLKRGDTVWEETCDYLACGFNLVPNIELASLLGCEMRGGFVAVNEFQETSVPGIYCAGEPTGIGGLDLSLVEGQIAGLAAAGALGVARNLFRARSKHNSFQAALDRTFALRSELKALADQDTFVCRCEDVTLGELQEHDSWRSAKLQTRCGMGSCQGRICGPATEFLLGWKVESVRPPIMPAKIGTLAQNSDDRI
jgi:NADPH-dependent 2,4-dienoyl-CoA reductase/sulfur reductase-like enzyme